MYMSPGFEMGLNKTPLCLLPLLDWHRMLWKHASSHRRFGFLYYTRYTRKVRWNTPAFRILPQKSEPRSSFHGHDCDGGRWWSPRRCRGLECHWRPPLRSRGFANATRRFLRSMFRLSKRHRNYIDKRALWRLVMIRKEKPSVWISSSDLQNSWIVNCKLVRQL